MNPDISENLQIILIRNLKLIQDSSNFDPLKPLSKMGLDSMSAVNLLLEIEETFKIQFPDEMLNSETFYNFTTLYKTINILLNRSLNV